MSTHRNTWKARERQAAAFWGCLRQRCSGSSGRADCSRSDSTHMTLFIETKLKANCATRTLFDETATLAKREKKTPVLMLSAKGKDGFLVVFHTRDRASILREMAAALDEPEGGNDGD